jgi:hypothetical protein
MFYKGYSYEEEETVYVLHIAHNNVQNFSKNLIVTFLPVFVL